MIVLHVGTNNQVMPGEPGGGEGDHKNRNTVNLNIITFTINLKINSCSVYGIMERFILEVNI